MGGGADDGYSDGCNKNDRMGICARGSSKFEAVIASFENDEYEKEARIIVGEGMLNMSSAAVRMTLTELEETMIHDAHFPEVIVLGSCFGIMKEDMPVSCAENIFPIHNRPQLCSNSKMLNGESNSKRCGYSTKFKK